VMTTEPVSETREFSVEDILVARKKLTEKEVEVPKVSTIEEGILTVVIIQEGEEDDYFWQSIDGKKEYVDVPFPREPKLFFLRKRFRSLQLSSYF